MQDFILRDYRTFSGKALEDYFQHKLAESGKFTKIGNWWDRKGENEIDLVCDDEFANKIVFHEVKIDPKRIGLSSLKEKAIAFFDKNPELKGRKVSFRSLSVKDM